MAYIKGEGRHQGTLFPVTLDDLVPTDHVCRVIDAFVEKLATSELGFERAQAAETGRPGYNPRDMLKLYLYGYLNQIRSSRRLEAECRRNVELMWLLGRLYPGHKSIAEFRRMHRDAITAAGTEVVRFARICGLNYVCPGNKNLLRKNTNHKDRLQKVQRDVWPLQQPMG